MVVFGTYMDLGIAVLIAIVLAEYFKWRGKAPKGFNWLALGGVLFVFAGTFAGAPTMLTALLGGMWQPFADIFAILGWLFALIGTVFVAYETLLEK